MLNKYPLLSIYNENGLSFDINVFLYLSIAIE